ncbi:MAG TPA: glycosyltransferase family 4 protein [Solirubrobacteraceae bacterium]|nr:glycosyltransferase family 4 protein [Solirubrobacteraceae bacterium]
MRVHVVDPSAYTPPYDHALCAALAAQPGIEVELFTSRFAYGEVPTPDGYARHESFYRLAHRGGLGGRRSRTRLAVKLAEHVPDMLRYRRAALAADISHFQWLTVQPLDVHLLPRRRPTPAGPRPALVLTAHDVLPREPRPGQLAAQRRLYERFDAIVVHSDHGRQRLTQDLGVDPERVSVIPHGAFTHLTAAATGSIPGDARGQGPVVLFFGLLRPYKGLDVLLRAWRGVEPPAELWIAGMPRMDLAPLRAAAPANVRIDARFVPDAELASYFRRADLVVLPYLQAEQSGVLFTALAFGKPLLLSDVGGFPEIAATGAARMVPAGDPDALRAALEELLAEPAELTRMAAAARAAAAGPYSWEAVAAAHLRLYERLLAR